MQAATAHDSLHALHSRPCLTCGSGCDKRLKVNNCHLTFARSETSAACTSASDFLSLSVLHFILHSRAMTLKLTATVMLLSLF